MKLEVINQTNEEVNEKDLYNLCKYTIKKLKIKKPIFNIIIVNNERIREINKEYRKIDKETDVISFALEENNDIIYSKFRFLGDIYISIDKAKEQAKEYGHTLKREMRFLTVHGLLHLLGYDHIKDNDRRVMRKLEECVLNGFDVKKWKKKKRFW